MLVDPGCKGFQGGVQLADLVEVAVVFVDQVLTEAYQVRTGSEVVVQNGLAYAVESLAAANRSAEQGAAGTPADTI
ncbi:hypothetical protein ACWEOO_32495 [Kribbella sp. NPDC004138]